MQSSYDILYTCTCTIVTYLAVNVIVSLRVHYSLLRKAMVTINACSDVLSFRRMKYLENDVATLIRNLILRKMYLLYNYNLALQQDARKRPPVCIGP